MEGYQERLKRLIAEQLKEVDPADIKRVQELAAIQNAANDALNEANEKLEAKDAKYVELATAYKDVVTHQSFKPTEMDIAQNKVSADGGLDALFQELFGK